MRTTWSCPVWHPGDCEGTPHCPPRCPRYVAHDGTAVTVYTDEDGRLVAVNDGAPLAGARWAGETVRVERSPDAPIDVAAEVVRQAIARAHERDETRLHIEAEPSVLEAVHPSVEPAVYASEPGRLRLDPSHPVASALSLSPAAGTPVAAADRLEVLVDPESVAVFGATDREGSIGRVLLEQLTAFEGRVLPVSDRADELLGLPTVDTLAGESVDLAAIALPADAVPGAVDAAIEAGVEAIAILSAGFEEADHHERQRALASRLAEANVTAIGPNAIGVASTRSTLNASFAPTLPSPGGLSIVSHSGAMITAILAWAESAGIGVRDVVSLGNGIDVTAAELVRFWGRDPGTDLIAAYLEDLPDGRAFVEAARDVTPTTPIVALKAGRTPAGAAAASSHTGAIAGDDAGYAAAFDAAGVVRADGQDALFERIEALARLPPPAAPGVAVVTNAGGPGVIAADAVHEAGLELATLDAATADRLRALVPSAAAIDNPVDVLGDADVERIASSLEAVLADGAVGSAIVTTTPHPLVSLDTLVREIDAVAERYAMPVVLVLPGGDGAAEALAGASSVVSTSDAGRAAETLAALERHERRRHRPRAELDPIGADRYTVEDCLTGAANEGRPTLGVADLEVLEAYGVTVPETRVVTSPDDAQAAVAAVGGEAVLKAVSPSIAHKTDVGGVLTGVSTDEAATAYRELANRVRSADPSVDLEGVAVQPSVDDGVELLVGVTTHERVGPVVTVGIGGVLVEHVADVAHGLAPLSRASARELVHSLRASALVLEGPRGGEAPSLAAIGDAIARISRLAADHESIASLEVNPLIATPEAAVAVDLHAELRS